MHRSIFLLLFLLLSSAVNAQQLCQQALEVQSISSNIEVKNFDIFKSKGPGPEEYPNGVGGGEPAPQYQVTSTPKEKGYLSNGVAGGTKVNNALVFNQKYIFQAAQFFNYQDPIDFLSPSFSYLSGFSVARVTDPSTLNPGEPVEDDPPGKDPKPTTYEIENNSTSIHPHGPEQKTGTRFEEISGPGSGGGTPSLNVGPGSGGGRPSLNVGPGTGGGGVLFYTRSFGIVLKEEQDGFKDPLTIQDFSKIQWSKKTDSLQTGRVPVIEAMPADPDNPVPTGPNCGPLPKFPKKDPSPFPQDLPGCGGRDWQNSLKVIEAMPADPDNPVPTGPNCGPLPKFPKKDPSPFPLAPPQCGGPFNDNDWRNSVNIGEAMRTIESIQMRFPTKEGRLHASDYNYQEKVSMNNHFHNANFSGVSGI